MYHRIIIPVEKGADAGSLSPLRPLARELGGALTLLHVHHLQEAPAQLEGLPQYRFQHVVERWDGLDQEAELREEEWLRDLAMEIGRDEPGLEVSSRVVHAPLAHALAERHERVLVVVPHEPDEEGPGRTVRELVRGGAAPVLLVRPEASTRPIRNILVPLDGSRFSLAILEPVRELVRGSGAHVTLMEVVSGHGRFTRLLHPGDRSRAAAEAFLRRVGDELVAELGPTVRTLLVEADDPADAIVAQTRAGEFDLIAMATHGGGGIRRLLFGSTAEAVIRRSGVPVLVHHPAEIRVAAAPETEPPLSAQ